MSRCWMMKQSYAPSISSAAVVEQGIDGIPKIGVAAQHTEGERTAEERPSTEQPHRFRQGASLLRPGDRFSLSSDAA